MRDRERLPAPQSLESGSETIRGLRGDGRDERFRELDIRASAFAGLVVILAIIVAYVVEVHAATAALRRRGSV